MVGGEEDCITECSYGKPGWLMKEAAVIITLPFSRVSIFP